MPENRNRKSDLYSRTKPFTSAQYLQENLGLHQVVIRHEKFSGEEQVHIHDEIEMIYVHSGEGELVVNGVSFSVEKGTLMWLFPFHAHALITGRAPLEYTLIRYSLGVLMHIDMGDQLARGLLVQEKVPPRLIFQSEEQNSIAEIIWEIEQELAAKSHNHELIIFADIIRLVTHYERKALRIMDDEINGIKNEAWTALQYIQFNFNQGIDAENTGRQLGITPRRLNDCLRILTGMNFQKNLALARIRNACAMMQYEELTLPYIARYVGYDSMADFYRHFKRLKGMTPNQYRNNMYIKEQHELTNVSDSARALLTYVGENYREPINCATAAKALYISESAVITVMKHSFGIAFSELVCHFRLWVAHGLLLGTDLTVSAVALAVGFGSERSFTRRFRELYGCSPGQYRKER